MKKTILLCGALMMAAAFPAQSQLTVRPTGQAMFGKQAVANPLFPGGSMQASSAQSVTTPTIQVQLVEPDSLATAVFLGRGTKNRDGYITFGGGKRLWVGECPPERSSLEGVLELGFMNGMLGYTRNGIIFYHRSGNSSLTQYPFRFYTDLRANSFVVDSDSRLKSDVRDLDGLSSVLERISPVSYSLTGQSADATSRKTADATLSVTAEKDGWETANPVQPDPRTRFGFMAQEVREVLPELVIEDEDGTLGIDYIGFIPLLVDAVRDLRGRVAEQEELIATLTGPEFNGRQAAPGESRVEMLASGCVLEQNRPNPFSATSVIGCNVPSGISEATIFIYDMQGRQITRIPVEQRGATSVTVEASTLQPGMYIYALVADGVEVDTKRMIVTD